MTDNSSKSRFASEDWLERDGLRLFYRRWPCRGAARARVVAVHGFGEHGGLANYVGLAGALNDRGIEIWQADLRGHGRSGGRRGHILSWADYREDLGALVEAARGAGPVHLCGLSLGALIVLDYALNSPEGIASVAAAGPPLGRVGVPPWMLALGTAVSRWWPTLSMDSRLDLENVSRDAALREEYFRDPDFHLRGSARVFSELLAASTNVREQAARFRVPVLLMQGTADRICPPDDTFYEAVSGVRKCRKLYEGARHNLFLETNRDEVYADVGDWILGDRQ